MTQVVTRFAPSPTGSLHLGGARTALFCYLFARKNSGKFLLRIEDTDRQRSREEHTTEILDALNWLGLNWDDEPVYQSQRTDLYQDAANKLLASGKAYRCTCTTEELDKMREEQKQAGVAIPKYDGRHRDSNLGEDTQNFVIRFKNPPNGDVTFTDLVQGDVHVSNEELDDMVLIRMDGSPTYNFCAVVDDLAMGITHVVRGDDHLRNSLRQCNLYDAFNDIDSAKRPEFAHLPLILNAEGARLSKREGAYNIFDYKERGILPEALCSYMARLGWSHGDQELFSPEELLQAFDLAAIQKSPAQYDEKKMLWVNHEYIKQQDTSLLCPILLRILKDKHGLDATEREPRIEAIIDLHKERNDDLNKLAEEAVRYYVEPSYNQDDLTEQVTNENIGALKKLNEELAALQDWNADNIKALLKQIVADDDNIKFPHVAMPLRLALTGTINFPSIDKVTELLGKDTAITRLGVMLNQVNL